MSSELQQLYIDFKNINDDYPDWMSFSENIENIDDIVVYDCNETILQRASYLNEIDIVKRCIKLGATIDKLDIHNKSSLYWAISDRGYDMAELLLSSGADPNIKFNDTPLIFHFFSLKARVGIELLLRYGAMVNEFHKYRRYLNDDLCDYFIKVLAKRRWVYLKTIVRILSIHKRAVERVNHPDRLLQQGVFELEI